MQTIISATGKSESIGHGPTHEIGGGDALTFNRNVGRDATAVDKVVGDFTTNGVWNDLSLAAILPAGAKWVKLRVGVKTNAAGDYIVFRKKGYAGNYGPDILTQVANVQVEAYMEVECDASGVIQYVTGNKSYTAIDLTVLGWIL